MARRMETLPYEIIKEVLLKLLVKSLVRFKSLSKPWCVLISHPHFAKIHYLNRSTRYHNGRIFISSNTSIQRASFTNPMNLYATVSQKSFVPGSSYQGNDNDEVVDEETDDSDAIKRIIDFGIPSRRNRGNPTLIVGSCDGLICIKRCMEWFAVLNPTTREWKEFSCRNTSDLHNVESHGFGYNSLLDDYKIVTINKRLLVNLSEYAGSSKVTFCSLRTNSWKTIQDCPYYLISRMGIYVSGAIHWIAKDMHIVAFDLAEDEFKEVPLFFESKSVEMETLGVHKGCLCMLQVERDSSLIIWTMVEYGVRESWTKLVIFPEISWTKLEIFREFRSGIDSFLPLDAENGKFLKVSMHVDLLWYNFNEETFELLRIKNFRKSVWLGVIKYEESLISPLAYGGDNIIDD